jgi:predicted nuclease of predicted toxin-antitoxin system
VKVVLDTCVATGAKAVLLKEGHEVEHVADWPADPGDAAILTHAAGHRAVVVTLDKDFGELAVVGGIPHSGIIRLVDIRANNQGHTCVVALERYGAALLDGSIVTIEATRTRVRPPDFKNRG